MKSKVMLLGSVPIILYGARNIAFLFSVEDRIIKLFKSYPQLKRNPYLDNHFWSRGYFVNTVVVAKSASLQSLRRLSHNKVLQSRSHDINEDMICRYGQYKEEQKRRG